METETNDGAAQRAASPYLLPASIIIAALLIAGSIFYLVGSDKTPNTEPEKTVALATWTDIAKPRERDVVLGDPNAPVAIIEYGDFQCPFCVVFFTDTEPFIRDQYIATNKAKMVYRHFTFIDTFPGGQEESHRAAEASECAKDQDQFWGYHDALMLTEDADQAENNGNLNRELFLKLAADLKLDIPAFTACIDERRYQQYVLDEAKQAGEFGVEGTPATYINGVFVSGAQPFEYSGTNPNITPVKPIIEKLLK